VWSWCHPDGHGSACIPAYCRCCVFHQAGSDSPPFICRARTRWDCVLVRACSMWGQPRPAHTLGCATPLCFTSAAQALAGIGAGGPLLNVLIVTCSTSPPPAALAALAPAGHDALECGVESAAVFTVRFPEDGAVEIRGLRM
jgi:hypothetical protein